MLNSLNYQGRLTADPELKYTASQVAHCEFTIAWSEKYKEVETKCFLRCKAWRSTAEFVSKYFGKGAMIVIEGHLVTEEWEKEGQKQSRTVCQIDKVHFAGSKSESSQNQATVQTQPAQQTSAGSLDDFMQIPDGLNDEDLPFN